MQGNLPLECWRINMINDDVIWCENCEEVAATCETEDGIWLCDLCYECCLEDQESYIEEDYDIK